MSTVLITMSSFAVHDSSPLKKLQKTDYNLVFNPFKRKLTEKEVIDLIEKHRPVGIVAGVEPLTRKVLLKASNLKVISRCGIGLDSIDIDTARERSIIVTNTPDAPTRSVAELTLGMIFSILRNLPSSDTSIRMGKWVRPMGQLLRGKRVGLVGCGRIGSCLGKMLLSLDCHVIGYDPFSPPKYFSNQNSLQELLTQSDIVSLHLPYNQKTHHFINKAQLKIMKRGSFLINCSRGGLIDENALYASLREGHLAGAALDCFAEEPYDGKLKELNNVVLTSHIGSYAVEGRITMETEAVNNLLHELEYPRKGKT